MKNLAMFHLFVGQKSIKGTSVGNERQPAWTRLENRPRAHRYGFAAHAEVIDLETGIDIQARTTDLSLYGCGLAAVKPFPAGTRVHVKIKHSGAKFEAAGCVAYATSDGEMGIAFVRIESNDQATLEKWISRLREVQP
jgi:PilZ domain-containing protein